MITEKKTEQWMHARQYILNQDYEKAENLLDQLIKDSRHIELYYDFLALTMRMKNYKKTERLLEKALSYYPQDHRIYAYQASLYFVQGHYALALDCYKMLIAEAPKEPLYWVNAAYCLCALKKYESAISFFHESESMLSSYSPTWLRNYAMALLLNQEPKKALPYFKKLESIQSLDVEEHFHYGLAYDLLQEKAFALSEYKKALDIDLNHIPSLYNMSVIYQRDQEYDEAKSCWERILRQDPEHMMAKTLYQAHVSSEQMSQLPLKFVEFLFDQYSFNYDYHLQKTLEYNAPYQMRALLLKHYPSVKPGIVIDLGAGTGVMGRVMRDLATQMIALDCSEGMLLQAKKSQIYDRYIHEDLVVWSQKSIESADYFTLIEVSNYLGGPLAEVIERLWAALRPSGYILLTAEKLSEEFPEDFRIQRSVRFAFKRSFFESLVKKLDISSYHIIEDKIRQQDHAPVEGFYLILHKKDIGKAV